MRLSVIFVLTLAVSVILSSTATWGLTYSTSYDELQNMATGFVGLASGAVDDFGKLVWQLISDSSAQVFNILSTEYNRSLIQLNQTSQQLLQTTLDLMAQTKNATTQAQELVAVLVVSFGGFMQSVIAAFEEMGTDYASRLRMESATRAQVAFSDMLQNRILAIERPSRLYKMGMLNLSWPVDHPLDIGICTLMGSLCSISGEMGLSLYIGTADGAQVSCDVTGVASNLQIQRGASLDRYIYFNWPPYDDTQPNANFSRWQQSCLAGSNASYPPTLCTPGAEMAAPDHCNQTCGYDPACRPWYTVHSSLGAPQTKMSAVYLDAYTFEPVITLSYPIYSGSPQTLLAVAATDFFLSNVDAYLQTLSATASQLVAVVLNSSDLVVLGTSQACPGGAARSSGKPILQACDPALQGLGQWLTANRGLASNASLELAGTLWDVFPGVVGGFAYFVAVGMNRTEVYAVVTATSQAAASTLQNLSQQQTARMATVEAAALAQMDAAAAVKVASLRTMQAQLQEYMLQEQAQMERVVNATRKASADNLTVLTNNEMQAIHNLEDYHLSRVRRGVGVTFGSVVGILAGILLLGVYGTWAVSRQVQQIAEVIEDVAFMRVEELKVTQKSSVREVQRIEAALVVLVGRLAEYKSYMPAGLFQPENAATSEEEDPSNSPTPLIQLGAAKKQSATSLRSSSSRHTKAYSTDCQSMSSSRSGGVRAAAPVVGCGRLLRRSAVVMAVNVVRFQADAAQRSTGYLEGMLNRLISVVHGAASKAQGNVDAIVGDQVLVTFNAHFSCSDPNMAAGNVALEVLGQLQLQGDAAFPWRVQIGLAAGRVIAGHLGYSGFKSMVAIGAPMKVASLLAHLSGFEETVVLTDPFVEERLKYSFSLEPADLVALPVLGEHSGLHAKSIIIYVLKTGGRRHSGSQEWMYEVSAGESSGL